MRVWLAFCACVMAQAVTAEPLRLSPPQMRALAERSMAEGRVAQAADLARALILRDPDDAAALVLLAEAEAARGNGAAVADLGRRAHGAAQDPGHRFAGARLTALGHAMQHHPTRAQFWLRRARHLAPDAATRASVAGDYRAVADANPWRWTLQATLSPSDNVNGGTTSTTSPLFGLDLPFVIPATSRALSGVAATASLSASYRLQRDAGTETRLRGRIGGRGVWLSDEARALAPEARGADYATASVSLGVVHGRDAGPVQLQLSADLSHARRGGDIDATGLTVSASGFTDLGRGTGSATLTRGWRALAHGESQQHWTIEAGWSGPLAQAGTVHLGALAERVEASRADLARDRRAIRLGLDLARPVAGLGIGGEIRQEWRRYDHSALVPQGRDETTRALRLTATLPRAELYGFIPEIVLESHRTDASAAIFESRGTDLGLGIRSAF